MNMKSEARSVLIALFPTNRDEEVCRFFSSHGYAATVVTLLHENEKSLEVDEAYDPFRIRLPYDPVSFLDDLPGDLREKFLRPHLVLNHAHDDVLAPQVDGEGAAWALNTSPDIEAKTKTVNWVLSGLKSPETTLWVNVYRGRHDASKPSHCPGRYALSGFKKAVALSPRLKNMSVVNVCLTYFENRGAERCAYCLTRDYTTEIVRRGGDVGALFEFIDELSRRARRDRTDSSPTT